MSGQYLGQGDARGQCGGHAAEHGKPECQLRRPQRQAQDQQCRQGGQQQDGHQSVGYSAPGGQRFECLTLPQAQA